MCKDANLEEAECEVSWELCRVLNKEKSVRADLQQCFHISSPGEICVRSGICFDNSMISKHLHQPWYQAGHSETSLPRLLDPEDH